MSAKVAFALLLVLAVSPVSAFGIGSGPGTTPPTESTPVSASTPSSASVSASASLSTNRTPRIVAVYPNPVAMDDAGEFVLVAFQNRTNLSGWAISDGEATADLPDRTVSGRIAFSTAPNRTQSLTSFRTLPLSNLSLANSGETITLWRNETVPQRVDVVSYADAPDGECWRRKTEKWRPLGATNLSIARADATGVRTFVLPDDPEVPAHVLQNASHRILLAGYAFTSRRIADVLIAAADRGVDVHVVVDDAPVGGLSTREATVLDDLAAHGVTVEVIGGKLGRYDFHHAKYAVADDEAVVLTENWKPAGVGGHASRGWDVVVGGDAATDLREVFAADTSWNDTVSWSKFRAGRSFTPASPANGSYPTRFRPKRVPVDSVSVLVAPDNAESGVLSLLRSANESICVQQMTAGGIDQPFVRATLAAARRGVEVKILLSSAWYVRDDNRRVADWLNERSDDEELPLHVKLADPDGYEKIHAKGVVVDGRHVVVGSLNWNNHSVRENREVAVVLHGDAAGAYYGRVFTADWGDGEKTFPVGLAAFVVIGVAGAVWIAKREVRFESER
ncbi:phospholipase D-like domain-containing protein [Haladaptatus sp. W1]|uniref:phospholipase D-like domain-containing protein n=1 Tax=Haladaptatus sp. W1 TaxID=1897478 RepID=UPI0020C7880D|nr:phospholipase D-like domain-containing protein [Haladaptatus sp. W1]